MGINTDAVQRLYVAYFNRPADPIGLAYWEGQLSSTVAATQAELETIAGGFSGSAEYAALYAGQSNAQIIDNLYLNLFARNAEPAGLIYWAGQLTNGAQTFAQIALQLTYSAQGTDADAITNKLAASTSFTTELDTTPEILGYNGTAAATSARTWLATVTDVAATLTTAQAGVATAVTAAVAEGTAVTTTGTTFTLTASADTGTAFTGTANNDTYTGTIATNLGTGTTLNPGDVLAGGAGTDTLNISISGTNTGDGPWTTSAVTLTGIENISVSNFQTIDTKDNTIDLTLATGVTGIAVSASASTGDTLFTGVGAIVTAAMGNGAGDLSITYTDAAVVGTADAQTLNLTGQTAGTFTVAGATTGGVETLNISSLTAANTIVLADAGTATIATINVTGDQNLTLTGSTADAVTAINAATFTGKLAVTTGYAAVDMSITGGAANDTITFNADNFTAADSVDGGTGTDTLSIATTIAAATTLANVTNVEVLKMTGGTALTLAANVVPTTFTTADGTSVVTLNTGYTAATTVNLGVTGKVVNSANAVLTVNATAANMLSGADVTVTGGSAADTLNITTGTAEDIVFASRITLVDTVNIVDKGDAATGSTAKGADIKLSLGNYATSLTVDASALDTGTVTSGTMGADDETIYVNGASIATATVVLNVTGGGGADTLVGGLGNDILNGGAGNDSILGSAGGADSISGGDGDDTIDMQGLLTSADTIDGGAGDDTLIVTTLSATALANVTNVETLSYNGTGTLSANLSFTTIDLTNGTSSDSLTLATGYTAATTVAVDQDTVINTAGVVLTVTGTDAEIAAGLVTGSTTKTTDTLNIKAATEGGTAVVATTDFTGVDSILIVDGGDDASSGDNPAGDDIALTLTSYATALTIDASALDAGTVTSGSMNADYENLVITGASAKTLTVTGGSGADTLVGSSDAAAGDSLTGGAGNDTFTMGTNLTYQDTIAGGDGTDTITTGAAAVADVDFMKVTAVETLTLSEAATLATYFDATGITTVNVSSNKLADATGTATGHTFVASAADAVDSIYGGMGNDTFTFAGTAQLKATDVINGAAGTADTISLDNSAGAFTGVVALTTALVRNVENYTVLNANGGDTAGAEDADAVSLTFDSSSSSTVAVVSTVSGAVITDANDTFTVDASGVTDTDFTFNITGGAGNDVLKGGAAIDTINGGDGLDTITGGVGADALTGGAGADTFVFAAATASIGSAMDTIADFVTGTDRLQITIAATASHIDATDKGDITAASDAIALMSSKVGQYVFNTVTNTMTMDLDANGLIQASDFALKLTGNTALNSSDIDFNLTGTSAASTITAGAGNDTITGVGGADSLTGGAGDDVFVYAAGADFHGSSTVAGGADTDTLQLNGASQTYNIAAITTNLSGIEAIDTSAATTVSNVQLTHTQAASLTAITGGTATEDFQIAAASTSGTTTLNLSSTAITLTTLTAGTDKFSVTAAAIAGGTGYNISLSALGDAVSFTDGANTVTGGAGNDTITGGTGVDSLSGGVGNDIITSGGGLDVLTGGTGNDVFIFAATPGAANVVEAASEGTADTLYAMGAALNMTGLKMNGTAGGDLQGTSGLGIEQILVQANSTTTFLAAQLSGNAIAINGDGAGTSFIAVSGTASGDAIDLSSLTYTTFGGYTAFDANDSLVITGSTGADVITLTGTTPIAKLVYSAITDGGAAGVGADGDTITGFVAATDVFDIDGTFQIAVDDIGVDASFAWGAAIGGAGTTTAFNATTTIEAFNLLGAENGGAAAVTAANLGNLTLVAALLEQEIVLTAATGVDALVVVESSDVAGTFGIYFYLETGAAADNFDAVDLRLIGIVTGDAVTTADFTMA